MSNYLTVDHPDAFLDMPEKASPDLRFDSMAGPWVECPKCKKHGGWNLVLHRYGPKQHFQAGCDQCNSWGWVKDGTLDATCVHSYKELLSNQMFRHVYECRKCRHHMVTDSSG